MKKAKYTVGYGKPPKHSRFKPGRSGNPKGRPKGARSFGALLDEELKRTISVTEGGRILKLSKQSAMIKALLAKAMKGDAKSVQLVFNQSARLSQLTASDPDELESQDRILLAKFAERRQGKAER